MLYRWLLGRGPTEATVSKKQAGTVIQTDRRTDRQAEARGRGDGQTPTTTTNKTQRATVHGGAAASNDRSPAGCGRPNRV